VVEETKGKDLDNDRVKEKGGKGEGITAHRMGGGGPMRMNPSWRQKTTTRGGRKKQEAQSNKEGSQRPGAEGNFFLGLIPDFHPWGYAERGRRGCKRRREQQQHRIRREETASRAKRRIGLLQ